MDNIPEREQPKLERVIKLGEEFHPFDPQYTIDRPQAGEFNKSKIILEIEGLPQIPLDMSIVSNSDIGTRLDSITPFDPKMGYQIDSKDLNFDSRMEKFLRLYHDSTKRNNSIDKNKAPFFLHVWSGITRELLSRRDHLPQEAIALLDRLRILISFPQGLGHFEARSQYLNENDPIEFRDFYPVDSGPLPAPPYSGIHIHYDHVIREGFFLAVPSNKEKLAQIRARFVMVEEQPETQEAK